MKFWFVALLLSTFVGANAQSAKVIALSPEDAKTAKSLYDQQAAIEKKIQEFHSRVAHTYLKASTDDEGHTNTIGFGTSDFMWVKSGWGYGDFEFSEDFKFIVPLALISSPTPTPSTNFWPSLSCCISPANNGVVAPLSGSLVRAN